MFAYCGNNPVTRYDPTGREYFLASYSDGRGIQAMLQYRSLGGCCSGGNLSGYNGPSGSTQYMIRDCVTSDPVDARRSLINNGFTFYKGKFVMVADLLGEGSAFSFGIIVLDKDCIDSKKTTIDGFTETLNHEYGHAVHASQVGLPVYAITVAIPSFASACLSYVSPWVDENYYSLPWERIADQLGGVERADPYLPWADTAGSLYRIFTQIIGYSR